MFFRSLAPTEPTIGNDLLAIPLPGEIISLTYYKAMTVLIGQLK